MTDETFDLRLYVAAQTPKILALPTLVRRLPEPIEKIIGDLSDIERVLVGLDLRPRQGEPNG